MDTIYAAGCGVGGGQAVEGRNVNSEFCNATTELFWSGGGYGGSSCSRNPTYSGVFARSMLSAELISNPKLMQRAEHPTIVRLEVEYKHISAVKIRHALPALLMRSIYRRMHPFRTYYRQKIS